MPIQTRTAQFQENWGVFIRRNGTMEWNGGMERWNGIEWNGMEWNDHAHRARYDDLYPLCLLPSTKEQQIGKPVVHY